MTKPQPRSPGAGAFHDTEPDGPLRGSLGGGHIPGEGWLKFGAVLMTVIGAFAVIVGLLALLSPTFFLTGGGRVLALNLAGWGWLHLILGALVLATGVGLLACAPA